MQTTTTVHVTNETNVYGEILTTSDGRRFMSLVIGEAPFGGTNISLLINDPAFLDRLSNEADRLCREFVGDVPGGQATLTSAVTREPVNFTFPEPTAVVVP